MQLALAMAGALQISLWSQVHNGDGDISELKCHSCGEIFYVMCGHTISWKQVDKNGDDL